MTPITQPGAVPRSRRPRTVLWTLASLVVAISIVVGLSILDDVTGKPLFDSPVLQQTLSTIAILGAAFGPSIIASNKDTRVIREEVKNDHVDRNLREDLDRTEERIVKVSDEVRELDRKFDRKIDTLRSDFREDLKAALRHTTGTAPTFPPIPAPRAED